MEHPFGWKAEYFSGEGHLTPREHLVRTQLTLAPQAIAESRRTGFPSMAATQAVGSEQIVPVDPSLKEQTIAAFLEAFEDSVEFCNWSLDEIWRCEQLGASEPLDRLRTEKDRWEQLGQELEPWKES